ncbi:MAG TPA: protein-L-isoaspartate(D-aspartate) O-methyltransferase [Kiloniellales bacterium]
MDKNDAALRAARQAMVLEIAAEVRATRRHLGKEALDARVMAAMGKVPRHAFVPPVNRPYAYENRPQPIGHGQTISQPYMVAIMTDLAAVGPKDRVLEIGTGCGYQTAVLAELAARVYSVEVVPELANQAAARLRELGYGNVELRIGDGALGWPERAPFDAIVVTAAAWRRVPPTLIDQLAPGGRVVVPVDRSKAAARYPFTAQEQDLQLITKDAAGKITERSVLPVAFVPLVEGSAIPGQRGKG